MNNKKNYTKGIRSIITKTILYCGFFSRDALKVYNKSDQVARKAIRDMVKEGVILDVRVEIDRIVYHIYVFAQYRTYKSMFEQSIGIQACQIYENEAVNNKKQVLYRKRDKQTAALREILS